MLRALAVLAEDAIADTDVETPPAVDDFVVQWQASGKTLVQLADEVGTRAGFDVMRETLSRMLEAEFPGITERLRQARADQGAHGLAEEALAIVDKDAETSVAVAQARNRAQARQWTAAKWAPDAYGQRQPQTSVTVNLASLHLDAFRTLRTAPTSPVAPTAIPAAPVTLSPAPDTAHEPQEAR